MSYIQKLRYLMDVKDQYLLMLLVLFSIFISLIETIGISAIMPFFDIATNFSNIHSNQYYQLAFNLFGFSNELNFVIFLGCALIVFYILRGVANSIYMYSMANFSQHLYAQITKNYLKPI